jgi:hypothetical protein
MKHLKNLLPGSDPDAIQLRRKEVTRFLIILIITKILKEK